MYFSLLLYDKNVLLSDSSLEVLIIYQAAENQKDSSFVFVKNSNCVNYSSCVMSILRHKEVLYDRCCDLIPGTNIMPISKNLRLTYRWLWRMLIFKKAYISFIFKFLAAKAQSIPVLIKNNVTSNAASLILLKRFINSNVPKVV